MKSDKLKIGARSKSQRAQFECSFQVPENLTECLKLAQGSEPHVVARFVRGYRIWLQDAIGRPLFEAGASQADIQKALDEAKLSTTKAIGRPKVQPTATVQTGKLYTAEEAAEMLRQQGFTVVLTPQLAKIEPEAAKAAAAVLAKQGIKVTH